jgi:Caspase domain/Sel1 repeat
MGEGNLKALFMIMLVGAMVSTVLSQEVINKRVALVIGVQNYTAVPALRNSLSDARDMSATLKLKGFEVIEVLDPLNKKDMQDGIRKYFNLVRGQKNLAGLIYYSGHGIQVDGSNFLIPATADPQIKADLDDQCLRMDFVMEALEEAGNPLNILIMDACRNNPFKGFSRATDKGLNTVNAPKGSYIVYSTKPGSVASDGTGKNGLFTAKLLQYLNEQELNIEQVFKRVARDVSTESGESQRPWISSDYTGDFYFNQNSPLVGNNPGVISTVNTNTNSPTRTVSTLEENLTPEAMLTRGKQLWKDKNYPGAIAWLERGGAAGNLAAQLELGAAYEADKPIGQDYKKSFIWFMRAAEQGNDKAQTKVAIFLEDGYGCEENDEEAIVWYTKAAEQNNQEAQYYLAIMHLKGRGTERNELVAERWLKKSADLGYVKALNDLGNIYLMGEGKISQNKSEAIKLFRKSASQGDQWAKDTLDALGYE